MRELEQSILRLGSAPVYIMNRKFTKNYYYNKSSVLKLIYLYDYLNEGSFLNELISKLSEGGFVFSERKSDLLSEIDLKLNPNIVQIENPFGYV